MARLLLGVSGGIAAYKALELARLATVEGHAVRVVQTQTSERFVGRASFEAITGAPVLGSEFEPDPARGVFPDQTPPDHSPINHLALVENADVVVLAPATANTLAKIAGGFADSLLTTSILAAKCPVLIAPAMNGDMWSDAAVEANVELLRSRGYTVIEPELGALASRGEWGKGRLPDPKLLLTTALGLVSSGSDQLKTVSRLTKARVLVTAGGTREPIDSVRFVGNRSSGRMGVELASEAAARGAKVTLIAANVALPIPGGVDVVPVSTASELAAECASRFPACDVLLMAAAVADYRPVEQHIGKLDKSASETRTLELERTDDILRSLVQRRSHGQLLVGFAAEHGEEKLERGRLKLLDKGVDLAVVNDISRSDAGFESEKNAVRIVGDDTDREVGLRSKADVAAAVLDEVERIRAVALT